VATIIPELSDQDLEHLRSPGEAKVYKAFRNGLSRADVVLFQVSWILRKEGGGATDGETDFIVCTPDAGYVCIEVKGGGIEFDSATGHWFSVDRNLVRHPIKNPYEQAKRAKYSINAKLNESQHWKDLKLCDVVRGHAVFFPDIGGPRGLAGPAMPDVLIGCAPNLENPHAWIEAVFQYWKNQVASSSPLGAQGVKTIRAIFARSFTARPLVSAQLRDQEERRLRLTEDQIRVLDFLGARRRAAISGGAGTGKTVLAVEKAQRLASEGFNTLLTCYNRPLADHLAQVCLGTPNLTVMSFHQLCYRQADKAKAATTRDLIAEAKQTYPGANLFDVQLPNALAYSTELLADRFEAIVCDEGQDFRDEYWLALELTLNDGAQSPFYIFYDDNQNIYSRVSQFPIYDEPFSLTVNCRNTRPIHTAAYQYYRGKPVDPPNLQGDELKVIVAPTLQSQAAKLHSILIGFLTRERVFSEDVTVLIADSARKLDYYNALIQLPLPRTVKWLQEGRRQVDTILLETIQRFKGLESPVVIIWGLDHVDLSKDQELLYVGISRAKSLLVMVARSEVFNMLKLRSVH
jgi:hypothetical protein